MDRKPQGYPPQRIEEEMKAAGYISTAEAAIIAGRSPNAIWHQAAKKKTIRFKRDSKFLFMHRADLMKFYGVTEKQAKERLAAGEKEE